VTRPLAPRISVTFAELDCGSYGQQTVVVEVVDTVGNASWDETSIYVSPTMTHALSAEPTTGSPMTITPQLPDDYVLPAGSGCRWEFRWGDDASLIRNEHDETFGSMLFDVPAAAGTCAPWTFTLPWVPYRQYEVTVEPIAFEDDGGVANILNAAMRRFTADVGTTERRILTSSLPVAQVLPNTYTPIVGSPITYTRYLIGGATACCSPRWVAWQGSGDHPNQWNQEGGATFTITPFEPGDILVGWDRMTGKYRLGALYDPPVRYPDRSVPSTTPPTHSIGGVNVVNGAAPTTIAWTGRDVGWGIRSYQLQRSIDGGTWHTVVLPKPTSTSIALSLSTGHAFRFRVRAIDKAGLYGAWDYGPTFKPWAVQENSAKVSFHSAWKRRADATAVGRQLAGSTTAGSWARVTVTARAVAWVALKGPNEGKATVYVDGKAVATVDLRYASTMPHRVVWSRAWTTVGTHTIKIVVVGTAGHPRVDVDAFPWLTLA
jgi:hypothetical protein